MSPTTVTLVTIFVGLLIAFGGWVVAVIVRREQTRVELASRGGTVRNSEAKDLWDEADKIREYLSDRLTERDAEVARLGAAIAVCVERCDEAKREAHECRLREQALEARIAACERRPDA